MTSEGKIDVSKSTDKNIQPRAGWAVSPFEEMERMFDGVFGRSWPRGFMRPHEIDWGDTVAPFEGRSPKVDVINRDKEIVVKAELPGVNKENLEVSLSDTTLTLRATSKYEDTEEKGEYYRRELSQGEFVRTLKLPAEVDGAKAKASFKDGILELIAPKVVAAKRHNVKVD